MRFWREASKKAWHWRRRIQRFPVVKLIKRRFLNADPPAGIQGEELEPEILQVPVTVNQASADEVKTAQGLLEAGDLRVVAYLPIALSDVVEYQGKLYKVIKTEGEPPNTRCVAYLRRKR